MKATGSNLQIAVCSGKGGTGKTAVALSLAYSLGKSKEFQLPVRLLDADVEEPNSHLFLSPGYNLKSEVVAVKPEWDMTKCIGCGKCAKKCRYNAIAVVKGQPILFPELCHSCGTCEAICPYDAINLIPEKIGEIHLDENLEPFSFGMGLLKIGESLAPKVIQTLKNHSLQEGITILDGPPGCACSAMTTIRGASGALLVTEPTKFGHHDLEATLKLCAQLSIPVAVLINRSDDGDSIIEELCREYSIKIAGKIPFSRDYATTCSKGNILSASHPEIAPIMLEAFKTLVTAIQENNIPVVPQKRSEVILHDQPITPGSGSSDYTEVTILSGKGGTGKTTVSAAFASLAPDRVFSDCDVDAANLHLLMGGKTWMRKEISAGQTAQINPRLCNNDGKCAEMCSFNAIHKDPQTGKFKVSEIECEGCGLCYEICPTKAISMIPAITGHLMSTQNNKGCLIHAELGTGAENSGKLVTVVRNQAIDYARQKSKKWIISDGPPGIACPAIASLTGTDHVIIVTEPSVAAIHDLKRILDLARHFGLKPEIIINKSDLYPSGTETIKKLANNNNYHVLGEVPFDESIKDSLNEGVAIVDYNSGPASMALKQIWNSFERNKS